MSELIYKQDAKDAVDIALDTIDHVPEWVYDILLNSLDKVPSAEPRKKGKWILVTDNRGQHFECDKCGEWRYHQGQNFCSYCGADMTGGEEE